jgi:hypothetical protein
MIRISDKSTHCRLIVYERNNQQNKKEIKAGDDYRVMLAVLPPCYLNEPIAM